MSDSATVPLPVLNESNAGSMLSQGQFINKNASDSVSSIRDDLTMAKEMRKETSDPISSASPVVAKRLKRSKTNAESHRSNLTIPEPAKSTSYMKRSKSMRPESRDSNYSDSSNTRSGKFGKEIVDVYDFPGSSNGKMKQITEKGARTTMDAMKEKSKTTYGSAKRGKSAINPGSGPQDIGGCAKPDHVHHSGDSSIEDFEMENFKKLVARVEMEKSKSPPKTYGKSRRTKTGLPSSSSALLVVVEKASDDQQLGNRKRKSDGYAESSQDPLSELPKPKRFQRQQSLSASQSSLKLAEKEQARMEHMMEVSASQIDPVIQIPDTITQAFEAAGNSAFSVQVPNTISQEMRNHVTGGETHPSVGDSSAISVIPATTSSEGNALAHQPEYALPSVEGDGSQKLNSVVDQDTIRSTEAADASNAVDVRNSPSLSISFDRGLETTGVVLIEPNLTESQKDEYRVVSVSSSFDHALELLAHNEIGPSTIHEIGGASSTVANSTWTSPRVPTAEPLSSPEVAQTSRKMKRSKTGLEPEKPSHRRRRTLSGVAVGIPSSSPFEAPRSSGRQMSRRETEARSKSEEGLTSPKRKRMHVTTTVVTYEKLKDPDAPPKSLLPATSSSKTAKLGKTARQRHTWKDSGDDDLPHPSSVANSRQIGDVKQGAACASSDKTLMPRHIESEDELTQEQRDVVLAQKLQKQLNAEDERPRRSDPATPKPVEEEALPSSQDFDAGILKEMYKPRLSSRRSKSMASKTDLDAHERFVNTLPDARRKKRATKAKTKDASTQENGETKILSTTGAAEQSEPAIDDTNLVIEETMAASKPNKEVEKNGRSKSRVSPPPGPITIETADEDEDAIVAPSRSRRSKPVVADSEDELAMLDNKSAPQVLSTTAQPASRKSNTVQKRVSEEVIDSEDSDALSSVGPSPNKAETAPPLPLPEAVNGQPTGQVKTVPITNKNKRQKSDFFKPPLIVKRSSTSAASELSVETGLQTPSKQGNAPQSTPEETLKERAKTPHSPLSSGRVPYRVGLSKKTRLPSLLKIIRKDGK